MFARLSTTRLPLFCCSVVSQSQYDGGLHLQLVLEPRYSSPPHLPTVNKWQKRQCANCCDVQSTGMYGKKANYCHYTELLFCGDCHGKQRRPIPWRIVQKGDGKPRRVSTSAAEYLDNISVLPVVDLAAVAPATAEKYKDALTNTATMRKAIMTLVAKLRSHSRDVDEALQAHLPAEYRYLADDDRRLALVHVIPATKGKLLQRLFDTVTALEALAVSHRVHIVS